MPTLRQKLNELATSFASDVLVAIRGAPLEHLIGSSTANGRRLVAAEVVVERARATRAESGVGAAVLPRARRGRGGRLARRSSGDIAHVIDSIVGLLQQSPRGLRAEQIRSKLGLEAKELPRPLREGLEAGKLTKVGEKRATTYFAKGAAAVAAATAPAETARAAGGGRRAGRRHAGGGARAARAARPATARPAKPARHGSKSASRPQRKRAGRGKRARRGRAAAN
jgi:hypothetical protein